MFLRFGKVILYPVTLFTVQTLPRIVLNKLWFLSTHSSSFAARARYNISYTPYFTTRNLKHGSNVRHDYDQPVTGWVVWSYFLRVTWIHRLPERCRIVGCGSSSECGFVFQVVQQQQQQHTHTHTHTHTHRYTTENQQENNIELLQTDMHQGRRFYFYYLFICNNT